MTIDLLENGQKIAVTNDNRHDFVRLYLEWLLNKGIYEKFRAFYLGFHSVCASNALIVSPTHEILSSQLSESHVFSQRRLHASNPIHLLNQSNHSPTIHYQISELFHSFSWNTRPNNCFRLLYRFAILYHVLHSLLPTCLFHSN